MDEPTNEELLAQISNCELSGEFNEYNYGEPSKESVKKLVVLRAKRTTFLGIDDLLVRDEVDRYIKTHTFYLT